MRAPVSREGVRVPRVLVPAVCLAVAVSMMTAPARAEDEVKQERPKASAEAIAKADSDGDGIPDRPDLVSAGATARVLGVPVELTPEGTPSDRVLVNPDGTVTRESFGSPVRAEVDGAWKKLDLDLVKKGDGSFAPKVSVADVRVGGQGADEASVVNLGKGAQIGFGWGEKLPEPKIDGGVATYAVADGVELVVSTTTTGLATRIRLTKIPENLDEVLRLAMSTKGLSVKEGESSSTLEFSRSEDDKKPAVTQLVAWDARVDEAGDPAAMVPITAELGQKTSRDGTDERELKLSLPEGYLDDPELELPLTIDPDIAAVTFLQDTWVRGGTNWTAPYSYRLLVGRMSTDTPTAATRSYLQWDTSAIEGENILSATVGLFQYHSSQCSARRMNIHPIIEEWDEETANGTIPSTMPAVDTGTGTSTYVTKMVGGTGCAADSYITVDLTNMVKKWAAGPANGGFENHGIQLNVPSANWTDATFERRFCSSNPDNGETSTDCNSVDRVPYLKVTYNGPPNTPGQASTDASRTIGSDLAVSAVRPFWKVAATDPEASQVKYEVAIRLASGGGTLASCQSPLVVSGAISGCAPAYDLTDGVDYEVRTRAIDQHGLESDWTSWQSFTADLVAPSLPVVDCGDYEDETWYDERADETTTCTFTSTRASDFEWRLLGDHQPGLTATSGSATTPQIDVPEAGLVRIEIRAHGTSGLASGWKVFTFGIGPSSLNEPMKDDRSSSTFPVQGSGGPGATGAEVQWRYAPTTEGDETSDWVKADHVKLASTGAAWTGTVSGTTMSETPMLRWSPAQETGIEAPALIQVRIVFNYTAGPMPSPMQRIHVIPHAFGSSFPTKDIGPAELALFTGEARYSFSDVDLPDVADGLSFGRSSLSLAGLPAGPEGLLGPGWRADFGNYSGASGFVVMDKTDIDGTITLMAPSGESYTYAHHTGTRGALKTGDYNGVGETRQQNDKLKLETLAGAPGFSHTLTLTESNGIITRYRRTTAGKWATHNVTLPKDAGDTRYGRDGDGDIQFIYAPVPAGEVCGGTSLPNWTKSCKGLKFHYANVGTPAVKRLTRVEYFGLNNQPHATDGTPTYNGSTLGWKFLYTYDYDTDGKLIASWPQIDATDSVKMKTTYEYTTFNGRPQISKITPPGETPWRFEYDSDGRLEHVKREHDSAVGTGDAVWTVKYDLPLSGGGLPDVTAATVAKWNQLEADAPVGGTAVWGPNRVPASSPTSDDYEYAFLAYYSRAGRTTNAAQYGAGAWQIDSTRYDSYGNTTWNLGADGRNRALAGGGSPAETAARADEYATFTQYNSNGSRVEATYSPMREVYLEGASAPIRARTVTSTDYDNEVTGTARPGYPSSGIPEGGLGLPVFEHTSVTTASNPAEEEDLPLFDTATTWYRYSKPQSGDGDGWKFGSATRVSTYIGDGDPMDDLGTESKWSTTLYRYNTYAALIETRTPAGTMTDADGSNTNDGKSTFYDYYTANSTGVTDCKNKPEWQGRVCKVRPGGVEPYRWIQGYSTLMQPTRTDHKYSTTATRKMVELYDFSGRPTTSSVSTSGAAASSTAVSNKARTYSTTTGRLTQVTAGGQAAVMTYDSWGRVLSQTDGAGSTGTMTYDSAGRVASLNDGKGTYTYGYDGTDSHGKKERRGMLTSLDLGLAAGPDVITGAYDANGELIEQKFPGDVTAQWTRDPSGTATSLAWDQGGVALLGFSTTHDSFGRIHASQALNASTEYTYDKRDRLIKSTMVAGGACSTTKYGFDADSNRTSYNEYAPGTGGACQETSATKTITSAFNLSDRITDTGYQYDGLGRTTTVPAAHTDQPTGSNLTVAYHANDMVRSLTQTVPGAESGTVELRQVYDLDASDRISIESAFTDSVQLGEDTNHYAGAADSPAWTEHKTRPDGSSSWTTTWTRNVTDLTGGLGVLQRSDGTSTLQLSDLGGSIVASVVIGESGLSHSASYADYGTSTDAVPEEFNGYGWLGTKLRKGGNVGGVMLMGVRLYNPVSGRFLSLDPIEGGNDNPYVYPPDPINKADTSGEIFTWLRKLLAPVAKILKKAAPKAAPKATPKKSFTPPPPIKTRDLGWFPTPHRVQSRWLGRQAMLAAMAAGALCTNYRGMNVCRGAPHARGGTTIGNTYLTDWDDKNVTQQRLEHELVHVHQWDDHGAVFALKYWAAGSNACTNKYEIQANLWAGGYEECYLGAK